MTFASRKIVMVTGGNNGIGYEVVKALLNSGKASYHVLMGSRSLEKAKHAIDRLQSEVKTSNTVEAVQVDLTSDESIERAFEHVKAEHERVDVLVNNAGECEPCAEHSRAATNCSYLHIHHRRKLRPLIPLRLRHFPACLLHTRIRYQRRWYSCPHAYLHATAAALFRSPTPLHHRSSQSDSCHSQLLPNTCPPSRLAEA